MLPAITPADLMHPRIEREPFTAGGWVFEPKWDGFRALAIVEAGNVRLLSRNGRSLAYEFPEVIRALRLIAADVVLDCELVVPDRGHPCFDTVRRRSMTRRPALIETAAVHTPATLCAFDLLACEDSDVRPLPLIERKARLFSVVPDAPGIRPVRCLEAHGVPLFEQAVRLDLEGIVAKHANSIYRAGRHGDWLKIKNRGYSRQEAIVFQARSAT